MTELTKEEAKELPEGTKYIIYNPLTDTYKEEIASLKDIVHNKYCYEKLKFFLTAGGYKWEFANDRNS